jgi:hypothetical protein
MASYSTSKRRRSAPLGNHNAHKHSLYASPKPHLANSEPKPLDLDSQSKIDFIRHSMQRVQELGKPKTYCDAVDDLRNLTLAVTALTRLARNYHYLHPGLDPRDELVSDIRQVFREVNAQIESGGSSQA